MQFIFKSTKIIYEEILIRRPKIFLTILFIPILYFLGWLMAKPIFFIGLGQENISLIGTIFTFLLFIFSLPKWFETRWGYKKAWSVVGINNIYSIKKQIFYFIRGFLNSTVLLFLILFPLIKSGTSSWLGNVSPEIILNSVFLIIGVGFAEELIFRGWLLEELKNQFGLKKAIFSQALIFSLVHVGFDLPFWEMLSILFGLFLLGIILSLRRLKDSNSLWGCIGMHGGLVGIWFVLNNGLVEISKDAPMWIVGPGFINTNPLGGLYGIFLLSSLCVVSFYKLNKLI